VTRPPLVALCFVVAGALDLIFAFGLYLFAVRSQGKDDNVAPPVKRPNPIIAAVLAVIGILTIVAGVLQWISQPL